MKERYRIKEDNVPKEMQTAFNNLRNTAAVRKTEGKKANSQWEIFIPWLLIRLGIVALGNHVNFF